MLNLEFVCCKIVCLKPRCSKALQCIGRLLTGPPLQNKEGILDGLSAAKSLLQGSGAFSSSYYCFVGRSMVRWQMPLKHTWQYHTPDKVGLSNNIVAVQGKIALDFFPPHIPPHSSTPRVPMRVNSKARLRQKHAKSTPKSQAHHFDGYHNR
jgi:hypothetical protein